MTVKFELDLELIHEMAQCIYDCSWVSGDEIAAYMASCINDGDYDPDEWSEEGKGEIEKDRDLIIVRDKD